MNYTDSCQLNYKNLTITSEPFLLCDDVIICDIGLLLSIMMNTILFSVDNKHLMKVLQEKKQYTA